MVPPRSLRHWDAAADARIRLRRRQARRGYHPAYRPIRSFADADALRRDRRNVDSAAEEAGRAAQSGRSQGQGFNPHRRLPRTHAAGVAAMAPLAVKCRNDIGALARSPGDLKLAASAMRETIPVLKAMGHQIVPASQQVVAITPLFLLAWVLRLFCNSRIGEVGAAWHAQQAPDEMQALADDLRAAVIRSGVLAPAIRRVLDMK